MRAAPSADESSRMLLKYTALDPALPLGMGGKNSASSNPAFPSLLLGYHAGW